MILNYECHAKTSGGCCGAFILWYFDSRQHRRQLSRNALILLAINGCASATEISSQLTSKVRAINIKLECVIEKVIII